jgi:uncharacterized protein YbaR (Trm112 family)
MDLLKCPKCKEALTSVRDAALRAPVYVKDGKLFTKTQEHEVSNIFYEEARLECLECGYVDLPLAEKNDPGLQELDELWEKEGEDITDLESPYVFTKDFHERLEHLFHSILNTGSEATELLNGNEDYREIFLESQKQTTIEELEDLYQLVKTYNEDKE